MDGSEREKGDVKVNKDESCRGIQKAVSNQILQERRRRMKKVVLIGMVFGLALLLSLTMAFAQSSGNFTANFSRTTCLMDNETGALSGGIGAPFVWESQIKVPNGSGTSLIIRPSYVTGILTKTKLQTDTASATATAGIEVCVDLDQGKINGSEDPVCVMYDKRFQQLSSNLFTTILRDCDLVTEGIQPCDLELTLSTLGARSFDFVGHDIPGGIRTVSVTVNFVDINKTGGDAAACVGPGTVTVTQTKVFSTSDGVVDLTAP